MSEMIQRVARAISEAMADTSNPVELAEAAIFEMRDPTRMMVAIARSSAPYDRDVTDTWPLMIDAALDILPPHLAQNAILDDLTFKPAPPRAPPTKAE